MFQHTATRRWLRQKFDRTFLPFDVSTHSHPKVAAFGISYTFSKILVSTHSHPKVAALRVEFCIYRHSCFNTQPPEGGCKAKVSYNTARRWFQHTATRRWLPLVGSVRDFMSFVSTHSHPKVAALYPIRPWWTYLSFNTQPPEGGCSTLSRTPPRIAKFQHTATRRWLLLIILNLIRY